MKFQGIGLQNEFLMILRGPWPAQAGNLNIPIGILRFLRPPGPPGSTQNREIPEISAESAHFGSRTTFSASGPPKKAPERYVHKGF